VDLEATAITAEEMRTSVLQHWQGDVRSGSDADVFATDRLVRFVPEADMALWPKGRLAHL